MKGIIEIIEQAAERDLIERAKKLGISVEEMRRKEKSEQEERSKRGAEAARVERESRDRILAEQIETFSKKINIGVKVVPAYLVNVRMLHERGFGVGESRCSVTHIRVLEDFHTGRLHRKTNDLLCNRKASYEIANMETDNEITCPNCMKIVAKFVSK